MFWASVSGSCSSQRRGAGGGARKPSSYRAVSATHPQNSLPHVLDEWRFSGLTSGYGSTRWHWHRRRTTTDESFIALDVQRLAKGRLVAKSGAISRQDGQADLRFRLEPSDRAWSVTFSYAVVVDDRPPVSTRSVVNLESTACRFGG